MYVNTGTIRNMENRHDRQAKPQVRAFFDEATNTVSYLVFDPETKHGAIVDPVLDYDQSHRQSRDPFRRRRPQGGGRGGRAVDWVLETHAHADHLSGAPYVKLGRRQGRHRRAHPRCAEDLPPGVQRHRRLRRRQRFDHLFAEGEHFRIGNLEAEHSAHAGPYAGLRLLCCRRRRVRRRYVVHARLRHGAGRFSRRRRTHALPLDPEAARAAGRDAHLRLPRLSARGAQDYAWETTIGEERKNVQLDGVSEDAFVTWREGRDAKLAAPLLLLPSIQTNIRAGKLPPAEANGVSYIKIPVKLAS